jgi:hypothetical protein
MQFAYTIQFQFNVNWKINPFNEIADSKNDSIEWLGKVRDAFRLIDNKLNLPLTTDQDRIEYSSHIFRQVQMNLLWLWLIVIYIWPRDRLHGCS